jgi:tetratricopeptide (TPR) repeat protein
MPVRTLPLVLASAACLAGSAATGGELRDLHYGEALYHAHQERYFEALERLDAEVALHHGVDEPELDSLYPHIDDAEFGLGDFELRYRMHQRAGRAIRAVLEGNVPEAVRNDAAFRLARIHFQKGQPEEALRVLESIDGEVPEPIREDLAFLRANVYLALDRPADAVAPLRRLQGSDALAGFAAYNLGIARLREGRTGEAIELLDQAGRVAGRDRATRAIRDKANLLLGTLLFEGSEFGRAERSFDRVRLEGPFSNQALLRAGWADASAERYERALVPWSLLVEREPTDAAVQEALLALPFAYSRLEVHGRAAVLYGRAVEAFAGELAKLDASLRSVREGAFLGALVREEIRRDEDWVIHLRSLSDAPETFYLATLMASHDFQTALQNYLDLEDMREKLVAWQTSLDAFEDLVAERRRYFEPRLPEIDAAFRSLDARMRLRVEQREHLARRLEGMLTAPRPEHLATSEELAVGAALERLTARLGDGDDVASAALRERIRRLRGVLRFGLETAYPERLDAAHAHLRELDAELAVLKTRYDAFVRLRQTAPHGYADTEGPIGRLRTRTEEALARLDRLMARQGYVLERVASRELERRRERLVAYQHQARFAFADSYDRAAKAQARAQ